MARGQGGEQEGLRMVDRTVGKKKEGWGETIKVIVQALLLALVIRTVLFQPFSIPSGSMMPTLLIGDYLFVSKWSYGFSKFSLPFRRICSKGAFSPPIRIAAMSWCSASRASRRPTISSV